MHHHGGHQRLTRRKRRARMSPRISQPVCPPPPTPPFPPNPHTQTQPHPPPPTQISKSFSYQEAKKSGFYNMSPEDLATNLSAESSLDVPVKCKSFIRGTWPHDEVRPCVARFCAALGDSPGGRMCRKIQFPPDMGQGHIRGRGLHVGAIHP